MTTTSPDIDSRRVIIRTVELRKSFAKNGVTTEALRGIDISIFQGEFISVMGPSGSGKSTFLRCLNFLEKPNHGRIFVRGNCIFDAAAEEQKLSRL